MAEYLDGLFSLQAQYPAWRDVFVEEHATHIGYVRKTVSVTGTAGQKILIGTILIDNDDGTVTIPANAAAIATAVTDGKKFAIYAGNDVIQNINIHPTTNKNVTEFFSDLLTQDVVVVYRGIIGVGKRGLRFPANTAANDIKAVHKQLEEQGIHVLRQVGISNPV